MYDKTTLHIPSSTHWMNEHWVDNLHPNPKATYTLVSLINDIGIYAI